jgi:bifunctional UDP-N-acetylglucosamine pyrophosphorylase / glucosamine-1-phosphate N-acetyltransferase
MKLGVVILAAGLGKRMRSALPKVLHPLAGKPLLAHVLDTAKAVGAERIVTVYGHGGALVRDALADAECVWVEQAQQLGTGHAVMQAMPQVADMDRVLVLYGDVPLISTETLMRLLDVASQTDLAILTADVPDPAGYGRILRDAYGQVTGIVEEKDATPAQRAVTEINTGFLVADRACLDHWLSRIGNDNVQGEYYLTDVTALAAADDVKVATASPGRLPRSRASTIGFSWRLWSATINVMPRKT